MSKLTDEQAIAKFNEIVSEVMATKPSQKHKNSVLLFSIPRNAKNKRFQFGYTPWKWQDDKTGKMRFFALKYRYSGPTGTCDKKQGFASRKAARKRAIKWHFQYYDSANVKGPEQPKPEPTKKERLEQKLAQVDRNLAKARTRLKRASTLFKKWFRKHQYYKKQLAGVEQ